MSALRLVACLAAFVVGASAGEVFLPPTSAGTYCGCSKTSGRCVRPAGGSTCRYENCFTYKCDAVQTSSPEAICIVKTAQTQLTATPAVSSSTKFAFPCANLPRAHQFLDFYSARAAGDSVNFAASSRNAIVTLLAAQAPNPRLQSFLSLLAIAVHDPSRATALSNEAASIASALGNFQDFPAGV
jgi:hypothetical protein